MEVLAESVIYFFEQTIFTYDFQKSRIWEENYEEGTREGHWKAKHSFETGPIFLVKHFLNVIRLGIDHRQNVLKVRSDITGPDQKLILEGEIFDKEFQTACEVFGPLLNSKNLVLDAPIVVNETSEVTVVVENWVV